ncbi:MAG: preprotein translocase subunit SecE [bacterium]|nr:preprotein translocase subunit SecE [bacterium]
MSTFFNFLRDSYHELLLVTWPKQDELLRHTIITVVFVLISSLILGLVDYSFTNAYRWFLTLNS